MLVCLDNNGKIQRIEGDVLHPVNEGARCQRNYAWKEFIDHPQRVNYPLRRKSERSQDPKWERVSWSQALDEIAVRLGEIREKYGAEALASVGGTNRTDDWARRRFFNLYGSPNVSHIAPICGLNSFVVETAIYGWMAESDLLGSKAIVVWGHNPGVSYLPEARRILDARENGAKLVVVDPRFTETASKADIWLQLRPGSDAALALAWINVIIEEGLYDREFVEKYTFGFERLANHIRQYTPEWADEITWIPKGKIAEAARLYASSKPASLTWGVAPDHLGKNSSTTIFARAILRAITGNLDIQGGNSLVGPHPNLITDEELELNDFLPEEERRKQIGSDRFRLMSWPGYALLAEQARRYWGKAMPSEWTCQMHIPSLWRAIISGEPYRIAGLIVLASNPMVSYANTKMVHQALTSSNLELTVVMDYWMTPTSALADYVLPAASWLERPVMTTNLGTTNWFIASERSITPLYQRRTDFEFWRELGVRLGQTEHWPWRTLEEANQYRISNVWKESYDSFVKEVRINAAPHKFKQYVEKGFGTPSGKVELYCTVFEKLGYDPLPVYEEPLESPYSTPIVARAYPFILMTGSFMPYHHSEGHHIKLLRSMAPEPQLQIHPEAASKLGIKENDWVHVETKRGQVRMKATLTIVVDPRTVFVQKGWWFPEDSGGSIGLYGVWKSNANVLTDDDPDKCDPMCGSWPYRALLCKVTKAD